MGAGTCAPSVGHGCGVGGSTYGERLGAPSVDASLCPTWRVFRTELHAHY